MNMKQKRAKIYLAGGMTGISFEEQNNWREDIIHNFYRCYNKPLDVINPCRFYNFENPQQDSDREVMDYDLWQVKTSDLLIVNFNVPNSIGTAIEIVLAREMGIPIIGIKNKATEIHPWLKCCVNKMFTFESDKVGLTFDASCSEAVLYIIRFYLDA